MGLKRRFPGFVGKSGLARCGLAALTVVFGTDGLQTAVANGDTRTISMHHVHSDEDITITYKRNGKFDEAALKKLNWFLRDWRRNEATTMDPKLIDIVWEVWRDVGAEKPVEVIGGYRAPATNNMLRRRSKGVARHSQHTVGHAMDFYIPGASLEQMRYAGLRIQRGGVGYYPSSGSPFVHLDTGSVRHWPRMTYEQLARVFPNGRTVHVPSNGKPLPGYALALADLEKRGNSPSANSLMAARDAGVETGDGARRGLLASLFRGGKERRRGRVHGDDYACASQNHQGRGDRSQAAGTGKAGSGQDRKRAAAAAASGPPGADRQRRAAAGCRLPQSSPRSVA